MKKYDIIILPPEDFYFSINDLYIKNYNLFINVIRALTQSFNKKKILIKYRSFEHKRLFNVNNDNVMVSGRVLDYVNNNSIIVGPPGTIVIESLLNGYRFFSYRAVIKSNNVSKIPGFNKVLEIANNEKKLLRNIKKKSIFKKGYNKSHLLHKKALSLKEIVHEILKS